MSKQVWVLGCSSPEMDKFDMHLHQRCGLYDTVTYAQSRSGRVETPEEAFDARFAYKGGRAVLPANDSVMMMVDCWIPQYAAHVPCVRCTLIDGKPVVVVQL